MSDQLRQLIRLLGLGQPPFASRKDAERFGEELRKVNLRRMMWVVITTTGLSVLLLLFNLLATEEEAFFGWQAYDLIGSALFIVLGFLALKGDLPDWLRSTLPVLYVIFWLSLMDGYYFSGLEKYGNTTVYSLGVIVPGVLFVLSPRFLIPILTINHAIYCVVLTQVDLTSTDLLPAYLLGSFAVLISALAGCFMFAARLRSFQQSLAIRNAESNLRAILENIPFLAWLRDTDGRFLAINQPCAEEIGRSRSEIIGRHIMEIYPVEQAKAYLQEDREVINGSERLHEEQQLELGGTTRWFEVFKSPVMDDDGQIRGICGLARDVTDRHEMEQHLAIARESALAADKAKSEFLAAMSHEIRTPMNSVLGYAQLMREMPMDAPQREHLETIVQSSNLLLAVINDILDFSKIEAGSIQLTSDSFDMVKLARNAIRMFEAQADAKGLDLELDATPESLPVRGDYHRIQQILVNLLSNAVKFTEAGKVVLEIRAAKEKGPDGRRRIRFAVSDTGVGVPEDQRELLFEPFRQLDSSPGRRHGGTGLGLVIVSRLCQLMDGAISFESEVGRGSTFTAEIRLVDAGPVGPTDRDEGGTVERELTGKRVLVVEDNSANRRLVELILGRWKAEVETARSGEEALERLDSEHYDVVLMDVQMPGMDGMEATRILRQREAERECRRTPVIALTAFATTADRQLCLDAGMDDFVTKPLTPDTLWAGLSKALGADLPAERPVP